MDDPTCPRCRQPMQPGFARAPHGIQWRRADGAPLRFRWIGSALRHTLAWWTFRENPAWHCAACQIVTIDHSRSIAAGKGDGTAVDP